MERFLPPKAKRVLVIAPHPDDETIGCGGTIALYTSGGCDVHLLIVSDGGKVCQEPGIVELRKNETLQASKILRMKEVAFLEFPDGELKSYVNDIKEEIKKYVLKLRPDIIYSPSLVDHHEDHLTVAEASLWILNTVPDIKIAFYNVYGAVRFNLLVDISEVLQVKEKTLLNYRYSLLQQPDLFCEAVKGLNKFLAFYAMQNRYYEAFYIVDRPSDKSSLLQWYAYNGWNIDPAESFLSKLRITDEILFELHKSYNALKEKETIIRNQSEELENKDKIIRELGTSLDNINRTLMWRLVSRFYRYRDRVLPKNSKRRRVYDLITSSLKSKMR
ncbi:MAG: PIG-L deacetylase family protein [Ignavibacterium sp.]